MGRLTGQPILQPQQWEQVKRGGRRAVEDWIDRQMRGKDAVVVLVGTETADRPFVQYEIEKGWERLRMLGVRIHALTPIPQMA